MKQITTNRSFRLLASFFLIVSVLVVLAPLTACSSSASSVDEAPLPAPAPASYPEAAVAPLSADFTLSAVAFVGLLDAGWNLGNTLDAHVSGKAGLSTETSWGQPTTTQAMMQGLKDSGITTVRIPISWHNHVDAAFTIDPQWMARVKTVVDYAIAEGLYVIINIHHDNDVEYYFPDEAHAARSMEYVKRVWKQVALTFRNYDERLVFELLNEPRLVGYANEWGWSDSDARHVEAARVIGELEQAALDEIRATGSNNANRYVMITPYVASPWASFSSHFDMPSDTASDKLIVSVHAYTPYVFAMQSPGDLTFTNAHKADIDSFMGQLNTRFVSHGVPVIIGEYGATNKNNLSERVAWFSYFCEKAESYGMSTILWDNGNYLIKEPGDYEELYGFYNRTAQTWYFDDILSAIVNAYAP